MNQKQTFYFSCPIYIVGGGSVGSFLALKFSKSASVKVIINQHWRGREFQKEIVFVNKRKNKKYFIPCIGWDGIDKFPKNSFIIVATKAYSLKGVLSELKKRFSSGCKVVLCQNGLGIFTEARKFFLARHIIRVLFWFGVR
ncbi:MAG: hypothetical protein HY072_06755, partial [Deltaproteobacteria bacterium]|nr:hypothetical protein [Deltaproteobacteria bacterium]